MKWVKGNCYDGEFVDGRFQGYVMNITEGPLYAHPDLDVCHTIYYVNPH